MKCQKNYLVNGGVVRTPLLSSKYYQNINSESILELIKHPVIRDAIFLSSPNFLDELDKLTGGKIKDVKTIDGILSTAYKFITRLSARSTPFGLSGNINYMNVTESSVIHNSSFQFDKLCTYTRMDLLSIKLIIQHILEHTHLKKSISYQTNNLLFIVGDTYRYYESNGNGNLIDYDISKVERNEVLDCIIDYSGKEFRTINQIVNNTISLHEDFDERTIEEFVHELIDEKILCSSIETVYTSFDPLSHLIFLLETEGDKTDTFLTFCISKLKIIKNLVHSNATVIEKFNQISSELSEIGVNPSKKDVLHIDSSKKTNNPITLSFNEKDKEAILKIKNLLASFVPEEENRFEQFKKRFLSRYGDLKMPLLFVLDPEFGIGYRSYSENLDVTPLQEGILTGQKEVKQGIQLSKSELLLLNLVIESKIANQYEIDLKANESIFPQGKKYMNNNFSAFLNVVANNQYCLDSFTSHSAGRLLNRFAHIDSDLESLCKLIINSEKESGKIKPEIRHLSDLKTDSIFKYNNLSEIELPCTTVSTIDKKIKTVILTDIFVSIKNDRIILTSKKYDEEIVPIFSEAKSYYTNSIDLFKFLADFQFQNNIPYISFNWGGMLNTFNRFPRLVYDNFIISPQLWILSEKDATTVDNLFDWCKKNNVPKKIHLSINYKDDNQILIDVDNPIAITILHKEVLKHKRVFLSELLITNDTPFKDTHNYPYHNEVIIPFLTCETASNINEFSNVETNMEDQHVYFPTDQWVYFKVYCNHIVVDNLLKNDLKPLIDDLLNRSIISKCFFVRYYDEDFHLRIRFLLNDISSFSIIVQEFNSVIQPLQSNYIVYNLTIDTYKREIERYGIKTMDLCEQIFFHDSLAVLEYLPFSNIKNTIVFAIKGINHYFNDFGLETSKKIEVLQNLTNAFFYEFNINKIAKKNLDKKYREYRDLLFTSLDERKATMQDFEQQKINKILLDRSHHILNPVKVIRQSINCTTKEHDICTSLIHMFLNRLFRSNHRKQEMILYYFLLKHFESVKAIETKKTNKYVS